MLIPGSFRSRGFGQNSRAALAVGSALFVSACKIMCADLQIWFTHVFAAQAR
jgi:hypothetical protein